MQVPHQGGSPTPYAQTGGGSQDASPYAPYQQGMYGQPSPYGQPQYEQQSYPEYAPPYQASYAPHGGAPPPAGYGYSNQSQNQYGSPPPTQQPYQHQAGPSPPGPPSPYHQGGPAKNNYQEQNVPHAEDRGVMGALAGGVTGAWAGHKVNHGFLGALGGALAGHKLQDAVGDHQKKKKKHKKSGSSSSSSSSSSSCSSRHGSPPPPTQQAPLRYAGNFSGSATQITLDQDYDLIASCSKVDGSRRLSSINLNRCLTNSDGHFKWSREGNFGASARNVRLADGGKVLEAELRNAGGHWVWDKIALDEKIGNQNGELVMV
ncbi:hypothetical protein N0V93_001870 [Gnomoniopsis smithogilvyi]|uniref:Cyanovirin-N domain-containing protein n=1 Tax=Gnomoniopsis smithogilvyi TaxID=1191159 RepID=A0A9W9D1M3_9PEZI|nr:hypothetical protein N0V93_001870 [Gnomoniopsis smithogilvyi]